MTILTIRPKNWSGFQHYRDRSPPWIKLHKTLLDDFEFQCLPVASKALAPMLWLLASEYEGGTIKASEDKLAFRLRMTPPEFGEALKPLINAGFFEQSSRALASRKRDAMPETERETQVQKTEKEAEAEERRTSVEPLSRSPLVLLPTINGSEFGVTEEMASEYRHAYPAVDVLQAMNAMRAWCLSNPTQRKTERGMPRFINTWLSKAQDRSGMNGHGKQQTSNDKFLAGGAAFLRELNSKPS